MKKLAALMTVVLIASMFTVLVYADASTNESFDIPKAAVAPVIDGKITDDEWDNALVRVLTKDNVSEPTAVGLEFAGATFRWMWDDAGLYVFAQVTDKTVADSAPAGGSGSYNSGDGVQVCIYADPTLSGSEMYTLFFFSLMPKADDGNAYIGEHFVYGTGATGADVDEAKIAVSYNDNGYDIECFIAKEAFAQSEPAIVIKEGTSLPLANIVMEKDGATQALFTDTAWFSGVDSNKYTLTSAVAGHVEKAAEPEPAAVETPPAADEPAPVTVTVPAAAPAAAPATSDTAVIILSVIMIAAASYFVARKLRLSVK